ncbi:MAG: ABC transporter permease [Verrucomicrobiota bacterium]
MGMVYAIIEGVRDIWSHKFRSFLTIFGVVLGAAALMTMSAITEGMARGMRDRMLSTGNNEKIIVRNGSPPPEQAGLAESSPGLTLEDAQAIKENGNLVAWVSPGIETKILATVGNRRDRTSLRGGTLDLLIQDMHDPPIGRFFTDIEIEQKRRVCVLGGRVYEKLFPGNYESAIGSTIQINRISFQVIGIFPFYLSLRQEREVASGEYQRKLEKRNERRGQNRFLLHDVFPWKNDLIVIPITTFQELFKSEAGAHQVIGENIPVDSIQVGTRDPNRMEDLISQVRSILLIKHNGIENFLIQDFLDNIKEVDKQVAAARLSGSLIAGIGLIVGGVGIANIMLASIADRIREIGIRRAIGARAFDIFLQVMMESLILAMIGGALGVATSYLLVYFLDAIAQIPHRPVVTWGAVLFSFSFSLVTGFFAGVYPAVKASLLSPVEALRYN